MTFYRRSRWPYRSWRRWGVTRSQSQGTRRFTVSFPSEVSIGIPTGKLSSIFSVHPWYSSIPAAGSPSLSEFRNCYGNLITNGTFQTYCALYDEVKINSVSVNLAILTVPAGSSAKIYSTIDRHANLRDVLADRVTTQVSSGPEVKTTVFTSLDRAKMWRYAKARDFGEKTMFVDSSFGNCSVPKYTNTSQVEVPAHTILANRDWFENNFCFSPMVSFFVELTGTPPANSTIGISLSVRWNVTFRNPKYSTGADAVVDGDDVSGNAKFSEMKSDAIKSVKEENDGMEEAPSLKKKKVVYEEEEIPDEEEEEDDYEEQEPITQPFKSPVKKAGKKSS